MTTNINADTSTGGAVITGDASGVLALQAAGTTQVTINTSGVTLANPLPIASGGTGGSATPTAGGVVYGTGTAQAVTSAGTSGQLLQSNGSSAPSWVSAPASAMTLISTQTASSSASIAWTGLSGYNHYMLIVDGIAPNTAGATFYVQVGTGAGPTYITSGYTTNSLAAVGNGAPYNDVSITAALIQSDSWNGGIRTTSYASGNLTLNNMTNSKLTVGSGILSHVDQTNNALNLVIVNGQSTGNTTAKTAVRILFDFGNIASGTASLYGITS